MAWNEPIPLPPDFDRKREEARKHYDALDRRGKLLADLRALAAAPGSASNIISLAADELELAWHVELAIKSAIYCCPDCETNVFQSDSIDWPK